MPIAEIPHGIEEQDTQVDQKEVKEPTSSSSFQETALAAAAEINNIHTSGKEDFSTDKTLEALQMCIEADVQTASVVTKALELSHIAAPDEKIDYLDQVDYLMEEVHKFNDNPNLYRTEYSDKLTKLFEFFKALSYLIATESK